MPEVRDAHLAHAVRLHLGDETERVLSHHGLLDLALALGDGVESLLVCGEQQQANCALGGVQVGDVRIKVTVGVEEREADRSPDLPGLEGRGGADEVEQKVDVGGLQPRVLDHRLLLHDGEQLVLGDEDGENQVGGDGFLQDLAERVPERGGERQAVHGGQQEAGVRVHQVQETVQDLLRAGQQPPEVVVFLVFEDSRYAGLGEHADDLMVDVEQLAAELPLGLAGAGDAHEHQGPLLQEDHGVLLCRA